MQPMSVSHVGPNLGFQYAPEYLHHANLEYLMSIHEDVHILGNNVQTHERDSIVPAH